MAVGTELKIQLEASKELLAETKKAGGFVGRQNAATKAENLANSLSKTNLSALKVGSAEWKQFTKDLKEFQSIITMAAKYTKQYSDTYLTQLKKQQNAEAAKLKSEEKLTEQTKRYKEAAEKVANTKTDYQLRKRMADGRLSSKAASAGTAIKAGLDKYAIVNKEGKEVVGAARTSALKSTGWGELDAANRALNAAKIDVQAKDVIVQAETKATQALEKTETKENDILPRANAVATKTDELVSQANEGIRAEEEDEATASVNNFTEATTKQTSALGKAFKQFTIYNLVIKSLRQALNSAVSTVKEIDKSLTEQAMVTGKTRQETYKLLIQYQDMATQLGTTSREIAEVATQFLRQGKTIAESLQLTQAAVSAAKVAGISGTESVNYLTTALNGFQLAATDAMKVSDKFAAVAAQSATSYEEIATALSKVASQANLAGMSIDYTTALLAKGIETTREAPETIGTALKTVIARMREMSDYGETLAGDTDVNNVETQLAYIGIALKDANGELRSTEDVLDELGKKWDTLNSNQQAAVAKALAGTRQQSRLIAMMTDYERVTELQEIALRSEGATLAQMATYSTGLEAASNRVATAWEKIVTTVTDSDAIINIVNTVASILDRISGLLSNDIVLIGSVAIIGGALLSQLALRLETQKSMNRAKLQEKKVEIEKARLEKQSYVSSLKSLREALKKQDVTKKTLDMEAAMALLDADKSNDAAAQWALTLKNYDTQSQLAALDAEIAAADAEIAGYDLQRAQLSVDMAGNSAGILGSFGGLLQVLTPILSLMTAINMIQQAQNANTLKGIALKKAEGVQEQKNTAAKSAGMFASVVSAFSSMGPWGVIAGVGVAIALCAALGVAIAASVGGFNQPSTEQGINNLSSEIYELSKKATSLKNVVQQFNDIDNQVLKTNSDLKEMTSLLDRAAESLSDEEKQAYSGLETEKARVAFLQRISEQAEREADKKRAELIQKINRATNKSAMLNANTTNSEYLLVQDAIYANNNAKMYEYVDALKETKKATDETAAAVQKLAQSMLEELDVSTALSYANNPEHISALTSQLYELRSAVMVDGNAENRTIAEIMTSDDFSIVEKVRAYTVALSGLTGEARSAFKELYNEYEVFRQMSDTTLNFIDKSGFTPEKLNQLYKAYSTLQKNEALAGSSLSEQVMHDRFQWILDDLAMTGGDVGATVRDVFGDILAEFEIGSDEYISAWNALINTIGNTITIGVLDMGQNADKLKNQISSIYEKASKWAEMSDTEKTEFFNENQELFKGESGSRLYDAFKSGNYADIQAALMSNETLKRTVEQRLAQVRQELQVERARLGEDRDAAYIAYLEDLERFLTQGDSLYQASLEDRFDQQQKQLDSYKDYLQKQQDALKESLDLRKEAYQKYFDAINQTAEDEDYEEKTAMLIANISKLSGSTNADAINKTAELTKQLEDLEKERLQTLRQRAQEQIMSNIEDEIKSIDDKFDKLLDNEQALLNAMTAEISNPEGFLANMLTAQLMSGNNTQLGIETYMQEMRSTYGMLTDGFDWDNIRVSSDGNGNLILNVNGIEQTLSGTDQQSIYTAVMAALKQIGRH